MNDRILRKFRFGFLLNDWTCRFVPGFFAAGNVDTLLGLVPDAFDWRFLHFSSATDEHG